MNDLNLTSPPPSDATSSLSSPPPPHTLKYTHYFDPDSASTHHPPPPAFAYYYSGSGDADDRGYYVASDAPVIQAENGGFTYFLPAFLPGYNSYNPYLPFGVDGHHFCQLPYLPTPLFQPSGYYPDPLAYVDLLPSPYPWDPSFSAPFANAYTALPEIPTGIYNASSKKNLHSHFSNSPQMKSSLPSMDVSSAHTNLILTNKTPQNGPTFQSQLLGKNYFALYNQGKSGVLYSNNQAKASTRGWDGAEKPKTKGHANDFGLLGPRITDDKGSGGNAAAPLAVDGNGKTLIKRDQYNLSDFPTKYDHAFFFVIKSYSEDDIHKSIKYNVWASTPNGNKRLDSAYEDAQDKAAVKGCKCPVFLFFSVNASGQFCGIAEMIGRVDFNRNMDFWQQDKWNGFFPVKWHILKDVPNPQLRHIILENNDNKPVTNSRDTQEVRFPQGTEMLNIFKNYASKTSILDDFEFYESRQKVMQEKKTRPYMPNFELLQQKADELTSGFRSVDLSAAKKVEEPCKE